MRRRRLSLSAVALGLGLAALGALTESEARSRTVFHDEDFNPGFLVEQGMTMLDPPVGGVRPPTVAPHPGSAGGTIASDGDGLLVLDEDSGQLVRTDGEGKVRARLPIGRHAAQVVVDPAADVAYVSDRTKDRVLVVATDTLRVLDTFSVREPFGLALTPDGATLLVTKVADHELVAIDRTTGKVSWKKDLAPEPRGVAVSPDGTQAMVGFLTTGALARVELHATRAEIEYLSLDPSVASNSENNPHMFMQQAAQQMNRNVQQVAKMAPVPKGTKVAQVDPLEDRLRGRGFARNALAVAYVGDGVAVAPHQLSTPFADSDGSENVGSYGGGVAGQPPIVHRLAFVQPGELGEASRSAHANVVVHQPRAMAYDASSDTLYLAGFGSDQVMAVDDVSQAGVHLGFVAHIPTSEGACAPDGLAVGDDGKVFVHCQLSRRVVSFTPTPDVAKLAASMHVGPELGASPMSESERRGAELFRRGNDARLSGGGIMACANCHAEGRTDGLSWRIEGHTLQTPLLAGRLVGTHPYKWDGKDVDLQTSLTNTVGRLGGSGLDKQQVADLRAFVESFPTPRPPAGDATAIARGREVFESNEAACNACHDGETMTDGERHDLGTNLENVDTPSLRGLAHTAPYYHDGSARTLRALLLDNGSVHGMGGTAALDPDETDDLIAYLESL